MRWKIEGADATTGNDASIDIEAPSEAEARKLAQYNGVLVASVRPSRPASAGPVLDYQTPASCAPPADPAGMTIPAEAQNEAARRERWRRSLAWDVRVLMACGSAAVALGWIAVAMTLVLLFFGVMGIATGSEAIALGLGGALWAGAVALALLGIGSFFRVAGGTTALIAWMEERSNH